MKKGRWHTFVLETDPKRTCQIRYDNDIDVYVTYCPVLDLYSHGITEQKAIRALEIEIDLTYKEFEAHNRIF